MSLCSVAASSIHDVLVVGSNPTFAPMVTYLALPWFAKVKTIIALSVFICFPRHITQAGRFYKLDNVQSSLNLFSLTNFTKFMIIDYM